MRRKLKLTSIQEMREINLTPLIDLTFLLLITFIITFPLVEQGIFVQLPKASADTIAPEQSVTLTLDRQGRVFLNDRGVDLDELQAWIQASANRDPPVSVLLRGDEAIPYGSVVKVIKLLHAGNMTKMTLVTQAD